jgi:hypothetical protein
MISPEARERLASLMDDRRLELGLRWRDVAEAGGVSYEALRDVRNGSGGIRRLTEHAIETGLRWEAGSVRRILDGGEPLVRPAVHDPPPPRRFPRATPEMRAAMAGHLAHIRELIEAARLSYPDAQLTGAMIFPRGESNASWWYDRIVADRSFAPEDIPSAVAAQLAWDDEEARLDRENPGYAAAR